MHAQSPLQPTVHRLCIWICRSYVWAAFLNVSAAQRTIVRQFDESRLSGLVFRRAAGTRRLAGTARFALTAVLVWLVARRVQNQDRAVHARSFD